MTKFARLVDSLNRQTVSFKSEFVRELTTALIRAIRILLTTHGYHVRTESERRSIDHIVDLLSPLGPKDAVDAVKYLTAIYVPIVAKDEQMPERPSFLEPSSTLFTHEYARFIGRLFANHGRTTRRQISLAGGILHLKKNLPPLPDCLKLKAREGLKDRLTTPARTPRVLIDQVVRTANELFPLGWDKKMPIPSYAVTNKSVLEATRGSGGAQAYLFRLRRGRFEQIIDFSVETSFDGEAWLNELPSHPGAMSREEFEDLALRSIPSQLKAKVEIVEDPLKARVITKNNWCCVILKPLQKMIHSVLRAHPAFQLTGKSICEEVMNHLVLFPGASWVSGDYSAATDNFHSDVTEAGIEKILGNMTGKLSRNHEFMCLARASLTGLVIVDDELGLEYKMLRGQLMGSLLSFPILCLVNFAVWRYSAEQAYGIACDGNGKGGRRDKVLINGDDIGFAATREHYALWKSLVPQVGLQPSMGKNYYSTEFITLNSRFYRWSEKHERLTEVPYLNQGLLKSAPGDTLLQQLESLGKMHDDFVRGSEYKGAASQIFISAWKHLLKKTCRNLFGPREHGGLGATPVPGSHGTTYAGYNTRQLIIAQLLKDGKVRLPPSGISYRYQKFQNAYLKRVFPNVVESTFEPPSDVPGYQWGRVTELVGEWEASFRLKASWLAPYSDSDKESWNLWNKCKKYSTWRKYQRKSVMSIDEYLMPPLEKNLWTLMEGHRAAILEFSQELDEVFL